MQIKPTWLFAPQTKILLDAFAGEQIYFVGGCVRDALLGIESSDIDLATPLLPDLVMQILSNAGIRNIPTGLEHGTITAVIDKKSFEITTFRRDVATDGRHATVAYTDDKHQDGERRDFTINALYCDREGSITDYFCGISDLQAGIVRFIGDANERICEDALRILRFFRFYAYYGKGDADAAALAACEENANKIANLSGERIGKEMFKLLLADNAASVIALMQEQGILQYILPGSVNCEALARLPQILHRLAHPGDSLLALALLLRSGELDLAWINERWKLSARDYKRLQQLQVVSCKLQDDAELKKQIRLLGKDLFIAAAIIAICEGKYYEGAGESDYLAAIEFASFWQIPIFPVSGDDLIALGFTPSKELGAVLRQLDMMWEASDYSLSKVELLKSCVAN